MTIMDFVVSLVNGTYKHWNDNAIAAANRLLRDVRDLPKNHQRIFAVFLKEAFEVFEYCMGPGRDKGLSKLRTSHLKKIKTEDYVKALRLYLQCFVFLHEKEHSIIQEDLSESLFDLLGEDTNWEHLARLDFSNPNVEKEIRIWWAVFVKKNKRFNIEFLKSYDTILKAYKRLSKKMGKPMP